MDKIIFLKYGELSTKKDNRNYFLKTLSKEIESRLGNNVEIYYDYGRMFITPKDNDFDKVVNILKNIFGIHEIVIAYKENDKDINNVCSSVIKLLEEKEFQTFKVEVNRSDKTYIYNSMELRKMIGAYLLKNINNIKVDIHNPELVVNVEIRKKEVLIYFESIKGLGGYPVGTLGKGLLMLSGGIDSPVAGYLAIKRGIRLEAIYFESPPHTSNEALEKVKALAKIISKYNGEIKLHVINFTDIQEAIYKNIPHDYLITIMRRMMYRISAIICSKINAKVIINGESIGQVASQTLTSMKVINSVVNIPVIRPLACFDKLEIIDISKKINAYETSILPFEDCCTIFVPEHPVINPELKKCEEYEKLIEYSDLIYKAVKEDKIIRVKEDNNILYQDLL